MKRKSFVIAVYQSAFNNSRIIEVRLSRNFTIVPIYHNTVPYDIVNMAMTKFGLLITFQQYSA